MDARELRIGNKVYRRFEDGTLYEITIDAINNESVVSEETKRVRMCHPIDEIEPIPLTEEWHIKLGGKKTGFGSYQYDISRFEKGTLILSFVGDYLYLSNHDKPNTTPTDLICLWNKDLKKQFYVHEWQNLFMDLTGKELTI